jgi:hypothetical protein
MRCALFVMCLLGVTLWSGAAAHAQMVGVTVYSPPVYAAPVYAAPVYAAPVYAAPVYAAPVYAAPVYSAQTYYAAPATVYAAPSPNVVTTPVVIGAPVRVYEHWGRHHVHVYYRW